MTEGENRIARAAEDLMAELAATHRAEDAARDALAEARRRHREVTAALARLGALMDKEDRQRLQRRMGMMARRAALPEHARPRSARQEAVMTFLIEEVRDSFRFWQLAA